jgi:hypothetical protein
LSGHFEATRARLEAARGTGLLLQDTTEFAYRRARPRPPMISKSDETAITVWAGSGTREPIGAGALAIPTSAARSKMGWAAPLRHRVPGCESS